MTSGGYTCPFQRVSKRTAWMAELRCVPVDSVGDHQRRLCHRLYETLTGAAKGAEDFVDRPGSNTYIYVRREAITALTLAPGVLLHTGADTDGNQSLVVTCNRHRRSAILSSIPGKLHVHRCPAEHHAHRCLARWLRRRPERNPMRVFIASSAQTFGVRRHWGVGLRPSRLPWTARLPTAGLRSIPQARAVLIVEHSVHRRIQHVSP